MFRKQQKRRQTSQWQNRKKPIATAEALPERLVCLVVHKEVLFCLHSPIATHCCGRKRTIVAVLCCHLLQRKCYFQGLGSWTTSTNSITKSSTRYFVKRLTRLGHRVTIQALEASARIRFRRVLYFINTITYNILWFRGLRPGIL